MSPHVKAHLFEPFFTTKELGKGTGLGLATVYGIVKQLGGFIWASSDAGQGATFRIFFPVTALPAGQPPCPIENRPASSDAGDETILLVEDDPGVRALAGSVLRRHGYHVLEATSGDEALRLAGALTEPFDLLLTDVVMPGLTGVQLASKIAAICPDLRVIYMSGYSENAAVHGGVLSGGVDLLEKPFSPGSLLARVRVRLDSPR